MPEEKMPSFRNLLVRSIYILGCLCLFSQLASATNETELRRWELQARNVTITRDDWGIAHVVGKTDADAVFGAIYAQAEDDFNRIETNYLNSLGRPCRSRGRISDLERPANEDLHRSGRT
jgi:acyl-homoserine-lactone acylase